MAPINDETALQDLLDLERSGSAVKWSCCQPHRPAGEASNSVLALSTGSSCPELGSLRPAIDSSHTDEVLAELADLLACGLRVRWPTG